jgi:putative PEP-CTERM system TPR-repeat lipoprotein
MRGDTVRSRPVDRWQGVGAALILAALVFMLAATAPSGVAAQTDGTRRAVLYEDALSRFQRGDYRAAVIQLKNVLKADPGDLPARVLLGRAFLALGDGTSAEKAFSAAIRGGADRNALAVPLGRALYLQGRHEQLLKTVTQSAAAPPRIRAGIHVIRGQAELALDRLDDAERSFNAARGLQPDFIMPGYAAPILGLARVLIRRSRLIEASELLRSLELFADDNADLWFMLGELARLRGRNEDALAAYDKAIALDPRLTGVRIGRATMNIALGRIDEARTDLEIVLAQAPDQPQAMFLYATVLSRAGETEAARALLERATTVIARYPRGRVMNNASMLMLAGRAYFARKNFAAAETYLSRLVEIAPQNDVGRRLLGQVMLRTGRPTEAIEALVPALQSGRGGADLYALLGSAYQQEKRYREAAAMYAQAVAKDPRQRAARVQLALTQIAAGNARAATSTLAAAFEADRANVRAGTLLATLHLQQGRYDAARAIAEALIEAAPDDPQAYNLAGGADAALGDMQAARARFERAVAVRPEYVPAILNLAKLDLQANDAASARRRYSDMIARRIGASRALIGLARLAERESRLDEAAGLLERLRESEPKAVAPLLKLVRLYIRLGRTDTALAVARDMAQRAPADPAANEAMGRALLASRQPDKAAAAFRRMVTDGPDRAAPLVRAAALLVRVGDDAGARAALDRALAIDPNNLQAAAASVRLFARMGERALAMREARRLRRARPELAAGDILVGEQLLAAGRPGEAVAAFAAGFDKQPGTALAIQLYRARSRTGDIAAAIRGLEEWRAARPGTPAIRRELATAYMRTGRTAEAIRLHEELLQANPSNAGIVNNLALLYQRAGDRRALDTARRARALAPDNPAVLDTYGWILVQRGDPQRALRPLRNAYARAPGIPEIRYHLAAALERVGRDAEATRLLDGLLRTDAVFAGRDAAQALLERLRGR